MPWIPYTYDNYVMANIGALWVLGFVIWGLRARKRRRSFGAYIRSLILSAAGLFVCLIFYTGYVLARQDYESSEGMRGESNLKDLSLALMLYAQDHHDHLPPANAWATDIEPYLGKDYNPEIFHAPGSKSRYGYAFNQELGGLSLETLGKPAETVMLFEADAKTINASGTAADFVTTRRMEGGYCAFADCHVQREKSAADANWTPLL